MPFMEGAVIGAVVGAAAAVAYFAKRKKNEGRVLETLDEHGAAAAMAVLDARIPAVEKIGLTKLLDQRERMAGLALIGNVNALEREIAGHSGAVTAVAQVNAVAMLGLAVRADPVVAADMLDRLALWTEHEGGRALALVKKKVRAMATLAAGLAGTPVPDDAWPTIEGFAREGGMLDVLAARAIAIAHARAGRADHAAAWDARVRARTAVFDQPPSS